jgi:hypothetical protein
MLLLARGCSHGCKRLTSNVEGRSGATHRSPESHHRFQSAQDGSAPRNRHRWRLFGRQHIEPMHVPAHSPSFTGGTDLAEERTGLRRLRHSVCLRAASGNGQIPMAISTTENQVSSPGFTRYRRTQIGEMRPYVEGEILTGHVTISDADKARGSPKPGNMIARNPANHGDQWLVRGSISRRTSNQSPMNSQKGARHGHNIDHRG